MRNTVLRDSKAIKVHKGRTGSPKLRRTKVINFWLIKTDKERCSIIWDGDITTTRLKLRRNSRKRTCNKGEWNTRKDKKKKKEMTWEEKTCKRKKKGDEVKKRRKDCQNYQEWGLRV